MTRKPIPEIKHPLDALGVRKGPEYLDRDLAAWRAVFESDRSTALPAFWALAQCVAAQWAKDDQDDPAMIQIPYWAAQAIAIGFNLYREAYESGRTTTFGEAFRVEGGGQGKLRKLDRNARDDLQKKIVLYCLLLQRKGHSRTDAIEKICNKFQIDERTARRHLKRWETLARRQLDVHLGGNSSGGSVAP